MLLINTNSSSKGALIATYVQSFAVSVWETGHRCKLHFNVGSCYNSVRESNIPLASISNAIPHGGHDMAQR